MRPPSDRPLVGYSLAFLGGFITVAQARVNGGLALQLGNGITAAAVNFLVGLTLVVGIVLISRKARLGIATVITAFRQRRLSWWALTGGVFGAFFVAIQASSVPIIGVALFSVALISGQTISSLLVDRWAIGTREPLPITPSRIAGSLVAVGAVFVAVSGTFVDISSTAWFLIGASFLAGLFVSIQQAVNARLALTAENVSASTLSNFTIGAVSLVIAAFLVGGGRLVDPSMVTGTPWWLFLGGFFGVTFIAIAAFTVPKVGVLSFALIVIAGQILAALAADLIWPASEQPVSLTLLVGAGLAFAAAVLGRRR